MVCVTAELYTADIKANCFDLMVCVTAKFETANVKKLKVSTARQHKHLRWKRAQRTRDLLLPRPHLHHGPRSCRRLTHLCPGEAFRRALEVLMVHTKPPVRYVSMYVSIERFERERRWI